MMITIIWYIISGLPSSPHSKDDVINMQYAQYQLKLINYDKMYDTSHFLAQYARTRFAKNVSTC